MWSWLRRKSWIIGSCEKDNEKDQQAHHQSNTSNGSIFKSVKYSARKRLLETNYSELINNPSQKLLDSTLAVQLHGAVSFTLEFTASLSFWFCFQTKMISVQTTRHIEGLLREIWVVISSSFLRSHPMQAFQWLQNLHLQKNTLLRLLMQGTYRGVVVLVLLEAVHLMIHGIELQVKGQRTNTHCSVPRHTFASVTCYSLLHSRGASLAMSDCTQDQAAHFFAKFSRYMGNSSQVWEMTLQLQSS